MDLKSIAMPVNTSEEEGEDLLRKCKRTKFSVSIVQPQQGVEVPDILLHKVSAGRDPMNNTDSAVQSTGNANGCMKGHANGTFSPGDWILYLSDAMIFDIVMDQQGQDCRKSAGQVAGMNHYMTLKNKDLPIANYSHARRLFM